MVRDTFEANPGLCELFKRKILDRAESAGLDKDNIDFDSQIDMKGTFHDNLRTFYREYPQLAQNSDYLRLKSPRPLSGVVAERLWQSYERSNERITQTNEIGLITPHLTITYSVGREFQEAEGRARTVRENAMITKPEMSQESTRSELMSLILDRVTAIAGENVTQTILHQIGREIGFKAYNHSSQNPTHGLAPALDSALRVKGLGRLKGIETIDHTSTVSYVCAIEDCSLCRKGVSATSTCSVMRGMVTRWFETHLRKKAETAEGSCLDKDVHLCTFRLTFRK